MLAQHAALCGEEGVFLHEASDQFMKWYDFLKAEPRNMPKRARQCRFRFSWCRHCRHQLSKRPSLICSGIRSQILAMSYHSHSRNIKNQKNRYIYIYIYIYTCINIHTYMCCFVFDGFKQSETIANTNLKQFDSLGAPLAATHKCKNK